MKVISVFNNKGGVGKSTIVQFLADFFSSIKIGGKYARVLLIDIDGQSSSFVSMLGIGCANSAISSKKTLPNYLKYLKQNGNLDEIKEYIFIREKGKSNTKSIKLGEISLMLSDEDGSYEFEKSSSPYEATAFAKIFKKELSKDFDFVFIDLPANVREGSYLSLFGLLLSDFVLIPTEPNRISINALPRTFNHIRYAQTLSKSKKPKIAGVLLNKTDKRMEQYKKHQKELEELVGQNQTLLLSSFLPNASALASATDDSKEFETLKDRYQNYYDSVRKVALELAGICGYKVKNNNKKD